MNSKLNTIFMLFMALIVQLSFAQEKTISGTVTDENALPLPGVNIVVKGTTNGTQTDFDGNYSISASSGATLTFSFVGYKTEDKVVGASNTISFAMTPDVEAIDEVVVTALGIKKEEKALGYSVSKVKSKDIEQRTVADIARVLDGKASGVQITAQSGTSGSATNVVIRGFNSINGSNQALFVVDGVPFSSDNNTTGSFAAGNVGSSRFLDLDPNSIESVSVLKGLAAANLYGTQGSNGVILITTKSGSSSRKTNKTEISVSSSYFVNQIASLPDYQDSYGGGFNQSFGWFFSNWGPAFRPDGVDGYLNDPAELIDANGTVAHPYATSAFLNGPNGNNILSNQFRGQRYEYRAYDNVRGFFQSGAVKSNSVNIKGGSKDGDVSFNTNFGHLDETGFTPNNGIRRTNISVGGVAKLNNKFTINGTMNYALTNFKSPPVSASLGNGTTGFSVFGNVFFTPRNVDLNNLPFEIPENGGSIYYRNGNDIINPRWTLKNAGTNQITNRAFGNASITYEFNENLNANYRAGIDFYNERTTESSNKNGVNFDDAVFGFLQTIEANNTIWDHFASLNGDYDLTENIGLSFVTGLTSRSTQFSRQGLRSTGQIVFDVKKHFNFQNQSTTFADGTTQIEFEQLRNIVGVLGETTFDYDNHTFLTLSARNDWVSNLPTENNSQFYASVSGSFLPTSAIEGFRSESGKGLNYLKLRAGLGQSAGFPTGFPTSPVVNQATQQNGGDSGPIVTNTVSDFLANPDLKPELISEFEVGFDSRFLNNRVNLNVSYFDRQTRNLIVFQPLSPSSGSTQTQSNIGKVEGDGWEADLGIDVFRNDDNGFNWNSRVNFTQSKQIVTEQDDDQILYAGFNNLGNAAIRGEQLGVIVGSRILRDDNGNFIVNSAGNYIDETNIVLDDGRSITPIIGNPNPDFVMNYSNSLSYKNWNLGFQINHTVGGDVYSSTISTLLGRGLIVEDRRNTFILPGVQQGTTNPNQTQINNSTYYFTNVLFGPNELQVYDASVIRLQELSFGYSFPKKYLDKTPFGSLSLTASGFNLWYDAYNTPEAANFDPNVAGTGIGNGRGFDFLNGPSSRRFGMSVKASF